MALEHRDRVADTTSTTGTGTVTLGGSAPTGYRSFASSGHTTGATVRYCIASADRTEWEVGEGVWTSSGATLTRITIYASSNAGALVSFSAGTKEVTEVGTAASLTTVSHAIDKLIVRLAAGSSSTPGTGTGWAKYPFDTVDVDTASMWDASNTRAKPIRAGYYLCTVQMALATPTASTAGIYKNGSTKYNVGSGSSLSTYEGSVVGGSVLVYCNGSTDYIEGWLWVQAIRTRSNVTGEQYLQVMGPM